ncbi:MAG: SDR family oxidoreductase [Anaerolineae bacterium]|nr:SDR family oxidoreductase [Anaerolineae bacterium]
MNSKQAVFSVGAAVAAAAALMLIRRTTQRLAKPSSSATAAVTGASSGIGAAFARKLAALGYDLVLVARRGDRLEALAAELAAAYGIRAEALVADLTDDDDVERVAGAIAAIPNLDLLVNNAGMGAEGRFYQADIGPQVDMIRLHVLASVRLARAALPGMVERGRGGIINVASVAGFMALPEDVNYCATKGYLITFSKALQLELTGAGVRVQALCPGFTHTEFHDDLREFDKARTPKILWMPAEAVVEASLRGLARGEVVCIPWRAGRSSVSQASATG